MLARIIESAGKDTLFILVSDHGAVPDGDSFNPHIALERAGLLVQSESKQVQHESGTDAASQRLATVAKGLRVSRIRDWTRTKAVGQRTCYIYVNLKGRDPEGIVEPEDYETVQREIIDALVTYVDPKTGKRPVALALTNQDARIIGLTGPEAGDVVYAIYPEWGGQHGSMLPTAKWGVGDLRALLAIQGSGIKEGFRMERTCWLTDIVPTICHLMDWPIPAQAEGAVLYQSFKNPNFKADQVKKLQDDLARKKRK
jgi:hypothetical protein